MPDSTLEAYFKDIRKYGRKLSLQQEKALLQKAQDGDTKAKDAIIKANLKLVVYVAKKHTKDVELLQDLIQYGNIGLIKAVEKFDYSKGHKFSTFAVPTIRGYILRGLIGHKGLIKFPRHVVEELAKYRASFSRLQETLGRKPTNKELVKDMRVSQRILQRIKEAESREFLYSLDFIYDDNESRALGDFLSCDAADLLQESHKKEILSKAKLALKRLPKMEQEILVHRFGLYGNSPKTFKAIGALLGVSRQTVKNHYIKTIATLRSLLQ